MDAVVLLVDTKRHIELNTDPVRILWAEDLQCPAFLQCAFKYNVIELNTALKPITAERLLAEYAKVIYLDPDVCVFSSLDPVISSLSEGSAVFTPHALSPYIGTGRPSDQDLLRFGAFNLGFFGVNSSNEAKAFLSWWSKQCLELCYYEPQIGLAVDQKWIDLASSFFNGIQILKHPGLNVAFWNLHERSLTRGTSGWVVNGRSPLIFVHFSSFVFSDRSVIAEKQTRHLPGTRSDFEAVGDEYREQLRAVPDLGGMDTTYGFGAFDNGAPISPTLRRAYGAMNDGRFADVVNPFASGGAVYRFAKRQHLLRARTQPRTLPDFKEAVGFRTQRRIIARLFRVSLRILGPDRYFALTRYLAYYSSILNQQEVFDR